MTPRLIFAILGGPGAGKSTQAGLLARNFDATVASGGTWLRQSAAAGHVPASECISSGLPMPDAMYASFMAETLGSNSRPMLILDGSPRNAAQVDVLADVLRPGPDSVTVAGVLLRGESEAVLRQRLLRRRSVDPRPLDDDDQVIDLRIRRQLQLESQLIRAFVRRWELEQVLCDIPQATAAQRIADFAASRLARI